MAIIGVLRRSVMWSTSTEVDIALRPTEAYQRLMSATCASPGRSLLEHLAVVLAVVGTAVSTMAVQRVSPGLVATAALSWSFVLLIQLSLGALVITSASTRRVGMTRALDLWFATHLPYTLWMLVISVLMATSPYASVELVIVTAIAPAAWTAVLLSAFCRVVLGTSRAGARWRATLHLLLIWTTTFGYVAWAAGGWFQIVASVNRMLT